MYQPAPVAPEALAALFAPQSIALVGATDRSRWSVNTYANLKALGFPGRIHLVHPRHPTVHGAPAVPSLRAIGEPVDLVYVMVPTDQVLAVLEEAADLGIRHAVVLTAGFGETDAAGRAREARLVEHARRRGQILLGPNGNGYINAAAHIAPYGLPITPPLKSGPVGIILQSGALASAVLTLTQVRGVGLSLLVSMGNEAMVGATDVLEYLLEDPATRVVAMFLETVRDPERFAVLAQRALERGKPLVVFKVGRSQAGAEAARAHTGALVGDDAVNRAAFRKYGVVQVDSLEDLIVTAGLLAYTPELPGGRFAAVTASGGASEIIADRAQDEGLDLPPFAPDTAAALSGMLPAFATVQNPLDVTGYVVVERDLQTRALEVVLRDPGFDFVLYLVQPPREAPSDPAPLLAQFDHLAAVIRESPRPVVTMSTTFTDLTAFGQELVDRAGLHIVGSVHHGLAALGRAVRWHARRRRGLAPARRPAPAPPPPEALAGPWSEATARDFLTREGVPVVPGRVVRDRAAAVDAARSFGGPVALKVVSPNILHKTDVGGVRLGLEGPEAVGAAYDAILAAVRAHRPDARLEGVLVSPMRRGGLELLVGIVRDPVWGPVLAVGLGGIWVEVLRDVAFDVLPTGADDVEALLRTLKAAPLLTGGRGRAPVDLGRVAAVVARIGDIALRYGRWLAELEINPLWVSGDTVEALDVLVRWESEAAVPVEEAAGREES
ncbi:MAG: acetate--CoA ligase family protein [Actinomycetia bacterium]|nr:acetate--CoA ligase family protein [Actinomycetes bacterium]